MDNAAKALEIAGGVLIAILIITLFVYMFNQVSYHQATQNMNIETQQLEEFNKKYEAYNKSILYGADVISVINMAISNNQTEIESSNNSTLENWTWNTHDPYYMNVEFKLIENLEPSIMEYDEIEDTEGTQVKFEESELEDFRLEKDTIYDISPENQSNIAIIMPSDGGVIVKDSPRLGKYYVATGAYEEFINRIFKCKKVGYHPRTGRINYMYFEEIDTSVEEETEIPGT